MKLLIATRNPGKIEEIGGNLHDIDLTLVSLRDMKVDDEDFEETGETFLSNSLIKANYYFGMTKVPTIADDSGLAVDHLHGEPGIKSRRWPGYEATDEELLRMLLERLKGVPRKQRTGHFVCALTFVFDPHHVYTAEHRTSGIILEEPAGPIQPGVPWSALFFVEEAGKVYSQLSLEEKNRISHRGGAVQKIKPFIIKHSQYARE